MNIKSNTTLRLNILLLSHGMTGEWSVICSDLRITNLECLIRVVDDAVIPHHGLFLNGDS